MVQHVVPYGAATPVTQHARKSAGEAIIADL
jgi:hypothetical protein